MDVAVVRAPLFLDHLSPEGHPETPRRLRKIHELFESNRRFAEIPTVPLISADQPTLERGHTAQMVQAIMGLRGEEGWLDADTFYSPKSVDAALCAAGSCVELALQIWKGKYRRGFCLARPPGHHATRTRPMGFCLFNPIALAVLAVLQEKPSARLAIVDFDLHHGNGTQDTFYGNPQVLFVSSHRFPYYPGTGSLDELGSGKGTGTTVNFPLGVPYPDPVFFALYQEMVFPILKSFAPDMIFVSAGFDGHYLDPMQGFQMTSEAYGWLAEGLIASAERAQGKILFVLEGGYNPDAQKESVGLVLEKMLDLPRENFEPSKRKIEWLPVLEKLRAFHQPYFPEFG